MRDSHRGIESVWRIESVKLIAGVMRMVRDVGLAEELRRTRDDATLKSRRPA
jgi:predicted RNA polymerase sigma factor